MVSLPPTGPPLRCYTQRVSIPRLNTLAPQALGGLLCRALAGGSDPAAAGLTQRRIEHLQGANTETQQLLSTRRAEVGIAAARELEARRAARQSELDLELFESEAPAVPRRRLLGPKPTPEQQASEQRRRELKALAGRDAAQAAGTEQQSQALSVEIKELEGRQRGTRDERERLTTELRGQLAGRALNLAAAGQAPLARELLTETRRVVRGDLMIATLMVLVELLDGGVEGALPALGELKTIFGQHHEPVERLLASLLAVARGRPLSRQELGVFTAEQFSAPAFFHLYQLVRVLAGWDFDEAALAGTPLAETLGLLRLQLRAGDDDAADELPAMLQLAASADTTDLIGRTLIANILLLRGETALIMRAAGIDLAALRPPRRARERWPDLDSLLGAAPTQWPAALVVPWRIALGCHVLLGARGKAPPELLAAWLEESYNWPKSDFYWWTLARVKGDEALLSNLSGEPGQLVAVA